MRERNFCAISFRISLPSQHFIADFEKSIRYCVAANENSIDDSRLTRGLIIMQSISLGYFYWENGSSI